MKVKVEKRFLREGYILFILLCVLVQNAFIASDGNLAQNIVGRKENLII